MERFKVNIYTECSIKPPQKHEGCCYYVMEYFLSDGTLYTRDGMVKDNDSTEHILTLRALTEALNRIQRPCEIRINTPSEYVFYNAGQYRYIKWEKDGWKNSKGFEVKNADLWRKYAEAAGKYDHVISYEKGEHSYREVMKREVEKTAKKLRAEGNS